MAKDSQKGLHEGLQEGLQKGLLDPKEFERKLSNHLSNRKLTNPAPPRLSVFQAFSRRRLRPLPAVGLEDGADGETLRARSYAACGVGFSSSKKFPILHSRRSRNHAWSTITTRHPIAFPDRGDNCSTLRGVVTQRIKEHFPSADHFKLLVDPSTGAAKSINLVSCVTNSASDFSEQVGVSFFCFFTRPCYRESTIIGQVSS